MDGDALRLVIFDGGRVLCRGVRFFTPEGEQETRDLDIPNHCYLVRHPQGLLMWDAGLPDEINALPSGHLERGSCAFHLERTLAAQMAEIGVRGEEVDFLAFSHLQIDHAGNAGLFPNAAVLVQEAEWVMAFSEKAPERGYRADDFAMLAQQPLHLLRGDHDVFGDGRVVILNAPGHTPGHQALLVDLAQSGPVILSGDLYYEEKDPAARWMPRWNSDPGETARSMERLNRIAAERGARWVINHDGDQRGDLTLSPGWME